MSLACQPYVHGWASTKETSDHPSMSRIKERRANTAAPRHAQRQGVLQSQNRARDPAVDKRLGNKGPPQQKNLLHPSAGVRLREVDLLQNRAALLDDEVLRGQGRAVHQGKVLPQKVHRNDGVLQVKYVHPDNQNQQLSHEDGVLAGRSERVRPVHQA